MTRIDLDKIEIENKIDSIESIDIYNNGNYIGRYKLEKQDAITELPIQKVLASGNRYYVPAYQRGYRWTSNQVNQLMNDIWTWDENAKYSLQPIVISQMDDGRIELVDGQQRLTTIFIILRAVGLSAKDLSYQIEYQTRERTEEFLNNHLDDSIGSAENIDWYHMNQCYETAKSFFELIDKSNSSTKNAKKWLDKLIDKDKGAFFIQYQILKEIDDRTVEQIFTGLNAGKIPLTNSELVKALILREQNFKTENYKNEFIEIAQEWDRIEKRLQELNFWAWLGQDPQDDSPHIDFVLDIVADMINVSQEYKLDKSSYQELYSYNVINKYLNSNSDIVSKFWRMVKQCFMTFEDWYSDNEDYHLIGYLSLTNAKKNIIKELYIGYLKTYDDRVKNKIPKIDFESLSYESKDVGDILLLFNIVTCIQTKNRFRFDDYVNGEYDVEHISPHSGFDRIRKRSERVAWVEAIKNSGLIMFEKLDFYDILDKIDDTYQFNEFYKKVVELTETEPWGEESTNRIGNLCLLDAETNRGYGNKPFPLKLKEIIRVDKTQSKYLLPTTKNVFLKYYSNLNVNNLTWEEKDAEEYEVVIKETINNYFGWENLDFEE